MQQREKDMVGPEIVKKNGLINFIFQIRRELKKYFFSVRERIAEECILVAFHSSSSCT